MYTNLKLLLILYEFFLNVKKFCESIFYNSLRKSGNHFLQKLATPDATQVRKQIGDRQGVDRNEKRVRQIAKEKQMDLVGPRNCNASSAIFKLKFNHFPPLLQRITLIKPTHKLHFQSNDQPYYRGSSTTQMNFKSTNNSK